MSSSAAAVAANSVINTLDSNLKSSARKRYASVAEKKSTVSAAADGENPGVSGGKAGGDGKDFRSVRDDYGQERPGELSRPRGDFNATPKTSPKRKKFASKPDNKPKWKTILSIMIKNGLLLAVLISLGRIIWKWGDLNGQSSPPLFTAPALVDQLSDVRETTRVLQERLRAVESKAEREISAVKRGLTQEIEERSSSLEEKFREIKARSDNFELSLIKVRDANLLSREDLQKILDEFKNSQSTGVNADQATLNEIRAYARDLIAKEIARHAADGLGRVDYALGSGGGRVVRHSEPFNVGKRRWFPMGRSGSGGVHANAQKMLQPSFGEPGQCFPLRGDAGFVEIRLRTGIIPDSVTLEHVAKSVGYDRSSAPKHCRISAWHEGPADGPSSRLERMLTLVEFTYDLNEVNAQSFSVSSAVGIVNMIRLDFSSNHGNPSHTCLYRLRVHGSEADPVKMAMGA